MSRSLKRNALPKSASTIAVVVASALVVILPAIAGTASSGPRAERDSQSKAPTAKKDAQANGPKTGGKKKASGSEITSLPFGELNNGLPFNASGGVDLGEGRTLICDNKTKDALFELHLDGTGAKLGPLVRRPITGAVIDDAEGMTRVELDGSRFIVLGSSFNRLHSYIGGRMVAREGFADGLLRVEEKTDGTLTAQNMKGVREWLFAHYPDILAGADTVPDQGGINIEGLTWDPNRRALMFGLRTPLRNGRPVILPVRLKNGGNPWTVESLEAMPAIVLDDGQPAAGRGIRGLACFPRLNFYALTLGKAISGTKTTFALYTWDGGDKGTLRLRPRAHFARKMKPESMARAILNGKDALLILDDSGGYRVIAADDERLH